MTVRYWMLLQSGFLAHGDKYLSYSDAMLAAKLKLEAEDLEITIVEAVMILRRAPMQVEMERLVDHPDAGRIKRLESEIAAGQDKAETKP